MSLCIWSGSFDNRVYLVDILEEKNSYSSSVSLLSSKRAPQPFKCAPKSQYPVTGFWDEAHLEENHKTAFTNQIGRIDVEGQCSLKYILFHP